MVHLYSIIRYIHYINYVWHLQMCPNTVRQHWQREEKRLVTVLELTELSIGFAEPCGMLVVAAGNKPSDFQFDSATATVVGDEFWEQVCVCSV